MQAQLVCVGCPFPQFRPLEKWQRTLDASIVFLSVLVRARGAPFCVGGGESPAARFHLVRPLTALRLAVSVVLGAVARVRRVRIGGRTESAERGNGVSHCSRMHQLLLHVQTICLSNCRDIQARMSSASSR